MLMQLQIQPAIKVKLSKTPRIKPPTIFLYNHYPDLLVANTVLPKIIEQG